MDFLNNTFIHKLYFLTQSVNISPNLGFNQPNFFIFVIYKLVGGPNTVGFIPTG